MLWPLVQPIDDFEEAGPGSTWSAEFRPWWCDAWANPEPCDCGDEASDDEVSRYGFLEFHLQADPDGFAGAVLQAPVRIAPIDFSRYDEIVFTAALESLTDDFPRSNLELGVMLTCEEALGSIAASMDGYPIGIASSVFLVPGDSPRVFALALSEFHPFIRPVPPQVDPAICLTQVTALRLDVQAADGETLDGRLTIDDIKLNDFPDRDGQLLDERRLSPWACCSRPEGADEETCTEVDGAPSMSLALEPPPAGVEEPTVTLRANPVHLDSTTHDLYWDAWDLRGYEKFRFAARFTRAASSAAQVGHLVVGLGCSGLTEGWPYVVREVELEPGRSSYALPLASFEPGAWALHLTDVPACLGQVDGLSFQISPADGDAIAGSLTVSDLAVE